jgi:anaerobic selenocysteine-containing dehydrogenase
MKLRTACPLDCPDTCSLEVTVEGGKIVDVDAAPVDESSNPLTNGWICKKVKTMPTASIHPSGFCDR